MSEKTDGASAPYQQLTFTEAEVRKVSAFVQFVYDKARFDGISAKDCLALTRHMSAMNEHIKKMDENIMEFVRSIKIAEEKKKDGDKRKK